MSRLEITVFLTEKTKTILIECGLLKSVYNGFRITSNGAKKAALLIEQDNEKKKPSSLRNQAARIKGKQGPVLTGSGITTRAIGGT